MNEQSLIEIKDLIKDYGAKRAVAGVDLSVRQGELFGLLGPNGAGKTTTMRIIHCFMPPTSGEVRIFGLNVNESPSEIKARMGVMPQDDNLDPDLSTLENLIVYARYYDIPSKVSRPRSEKLLEFVELSDESRTNVEKLSGGMRRRLTLARTLINEPELVVLDEPTTGMDPRSRHSVWDALNNLRQDGKTILMSTHYMEEAEVLCDRVAIINEGLIVETDTPAALMERHSCDNLEEVYLKLTGRRLSE
jgi:lipooligosaccharide transport system ATP-binding protein